MGAPLTIRLETLDGQIETIGVDRYRGIVAEGFTADADPTGSSTCAFTLKRPTDVAHPDLSAFTPCEVEINGVVVWDGRVRETPTTDGPEGVISVAGVGWQVQTDDDQYEPVYVETDITRWQDVRSKVTADLAKFRAAPQVNAGAGGIVLAFPTGSSLVAGDAAGVVIDMGPNPRRWVKRIVLLVEHAGANASALVYCRGHDLEANAHPSGAAGAWEESSFSATATTALSAPTGVATTGTFLRATFGPYRRYVTVFLHWSGGAATAGADVGIRIKAAQLFREAAYEAGDVSVLKASTVIVDALDTAAPLLSPDRSLIQPTSFSLRELTFDDPQTARAVVDAVNAVHQWRFRIRPGRLPEFAPKPNAPVLKIGSWPGSRSQDASAGSGEDIVNRVLVIGTGADGAPIVVERRARTAWSRTIAQPSNPSADVDDSGWLDAGIFGSGDISRSTAQFKSAPASFALTGPAGGSMFVSARGGAAATQPIAPGRTYRVGFWMRGEVALKMHVAVLDHVGVVVYADLPVVPVPAGVWTEYSFDFTPPKGGLGYVLEFFLQDLGAPGAAILFAYLDDVYVEQNLSTLVDRRGFVKTRRLPIDATLDATLGAQIGDVYLANHARTPFKGSVTIKPGGCVRMAAAAAPTSTTAPVVAAGDQPVHPSELLLHTGDLLRLAHMVDPDTGAVGRDGIIATVSYNHDDEEATVNLDNDRNSQEAQLKRMAIVNGR